MRDVTRREMGLGLCALAITGATEAGGLVKQVHATESPAPKPAQPPGAVDQTPGAAVSPQASVAGGGTLGGSRVFRLEDQPAKATAAGGESRTITHGTLATGESVNLHQSMQPAGAAPVPLHVIRHSEFICVREGELAFEHEDAAGKVVTETVGAGGVIYVAFGTNHRIGNSGSTPARYFVVAIGGDAK